MKSRIYVRRPTAADRREVTAGARASGVLHGSWAAGPLTPPQYHRYLERMGRPENCAFVVCLRAGDAIVGVVNITNIVLGAFRSGYLSYYVFAGYERRGYMREGLCAVIRAAFKTLRLHRLEANIQPSNAASIALAKSCGLKKEGYSPRYLKIAGRWRDHERWAIVAS